MSQKNLNTKTLNKVSADQLKDVVGGQAAPKASSASAKATVRKPTAGPK